MQSKCPITIDFIKILAKTNNRASYEFVAIAATMLSDWGPREYYLDIPLRVTELTLSPSGLPLTQDNVIFAAKMVFALQRHRPEIQLRGVDSIAGLTSLIARITEDQKALVKAAIHGDRYTMQFLLTYAAVNPNELNEDGVTPLHIAASTRDSVALDILLSCPHTDPNTTNAFGSTALHIATQVGSLDCVRTLLSHNSMTKFHGADVFGETALHIAIRLRNQAVINALEMHYLKLAIQNPHQLSCILANAPELVDLLKARKDTLWVLFRDTASSTLGSEVRNHIFQQIIATPTHPLHVIFSTGAGQLAFFPGEVPILAQMAAIAETGPVAGRLRSSPAPK